MEKKAYVAPAITNLKTVTQCGTGKAFAPSEPPSDKRKT